MEMILRVLPWATLAIALIMAIVIFLRMSPQSKREVINQLLFSLAVEAERLYGGKTGQVKKKQVIAWFFERYKWLARLIPPETLSDWIDKAVDAMNEWLKSNPAGAKNII